MLRRRVGAGLEGYDPVYAAVVKDGTHEPLAGTSNLTGSPSPIIRCVIEPTVVLRRRLT